MSEVLVKTRNYPPRGVYHEPDPDNPSRPKCDHAGREGTPFRRVERDDIPHHRACKMCTGSVEYNPETGKRLSTKLKEMDSEEIAL